MSLEPVELLERVADIARRAGQEILAVYGARQYPPTQKADATPLTTADLRAHRLIRDALDSLTPGWPLLSEEAVATPFAERAAWRRYWLVDPLDGTREFLARNGEFTVNIALIDEHAPLLGVVHVPVTDTSYLGLHGCGAWRETHGGERRPIQVAHESATPPRVVASRSHRGDSLEPYLARIGAHRLVPVGSSLKFCLIAEGAADVYPRLGPTSEWDTAAAHAVVSAAGGMVSSLDGGTLRYNTGSSLLNPHFVAYGPRDHDWLRGLAP